MAKKSTLQFTTFTGEKININDKTPVFAFCGIANPERFHQSLIEQGITPKGFVALQDHKRYDEKTLTLIKQQTKASGAEFLITTEKDAVKLKAVYKKQFNLPLVTASFEMDDLAYFMHFFKNKLDVL